MKFSGLTKYNDNPQSIGLYTSRLPSYRTRPFTDLWKVSIEHLRWMQHAGRGCLLLLTSDPFPYGTWLCSTFWDKSFSRTCRNFVWDIHFEHRAKPSRFCAWLHSIFYTTFWWVRKKKVCKFDAKLGSAPFSGLMMDTPLYRSSGESGILRGRKVFLLKSGCIIFFK